jgi:hypothetical protein
MRNGESSGYSKSLQKVVELFTGVLSTVISLKRFYFLALLIFDHSDELFCGFNRFAFRPEETNNGPSGTIIYELDEVSCFTHRLDTHRPANIRMYQFQQFARSVRPFREGCAYHLPLKTLNGVPREIHGL